MFQVDLAALRHEGGKWLQWTLSGVLPSLNDPDHGQVVTEPVRLQITGAFADGVYWLQGTVEGEASLCCSRCLEPFRHHFTAGFKVKFRDGMPLAPDEEPLINPDWLDLDDQVREAVLLALPMRPLCREDCKGLCPQCGKDLNEGPCSCHNDEPDPRWSKMAALLTDGEKGVQ